MSLAWKLFFSYLVVIAVSLAVLALATAFVAPVTFSEHMRGMGGMMGFGNRRNADENQAALEAAIEANFRQAVNSALLLAAGAATLTAAGVSGLISRRIVRPIRRLVQASNYIAEGHYHERLSDGQRDELGDLTRSFNRMASALAETETMRRQLIADVSHELKTPLASIKGYMEGLQDGVIPPTPETFQRVHREADRLQALVRDLQELSRAEADQLALDLRPCDGKALVQSATDWLRPQFEDQGVALHVDLPIESVVVQADFDRARQVLLNLLGNALQYTPTGGRVAVRLACEGRLARFSVSDTGIGLAEDDLERVFQRFYRVDKSRSRAGGGTGIGLTIARYIVEAHGGRIWAESAGLGQGSVFHFTLPIA